MSFLAQASEWGASPSPPRGGIGHPPPQFGASPSSFAMSYQGRADSHPYRLLVERIKAHQRSPNGQVAWREFCDQRTNGRYDPSHVAPELLDRFLTDFESPPPGLKGKGNHDEDDPWDSYHGPPQKGAPGAPQAVTDKGADAVCLYPWGRMASPSMYGGGRSTLRWATLTETGDAMEKWHAVQLLLVSARSGSPTS